MGGIYAYADNYLAGGTTDGGGPDQVISRKLTPDGRPRRVGTKEHPIDLWSYNPHHYYDSDYGDEMYCLSIRLSYKGNLSGYTDVDWIQSVSTTAPNGNRNPEESYLDGKPEDNNAPFYYGKSGSSSRNASIAGDKGFGGKYFEDDPGRGSRIGNYAWFAQLSLVGKRNGSYQNIVTFSYGVIYYANIPIVFPLRIVTPNLYQQSLINSAGRNHNYEIN